MISYFFGMLPEQIILDLAAGKLTREAFTNWLKDHVIHITTA